MSETTSIPAYRKNSFGQARVTLKDAITGQRKDILPGKFGTKASKEGYGRVLQQWEAAGRRLLDETAPDLTIYQLVDAYRDRHVE